MQVDTTIYRIGYRSGLIAFFATVAFGVVQLLQVAGLLHFPMDAILIYGFSFCIVLPFVMLMLALHYSIPQSKKIWSHAALIFTTIYAVFVSANYIVQLATVVPATIKGAASEVRLLDQTPHSMFWNFDALGYIFMGLATFAALPAFNKDSSDKRVRFWFAANALMTPVISFVYFYPTYSYTLLMLGLPWAITAPASMLALALRFRKKLLASDEHLSDASNQKNFSSIKVGTPQL